MAVQQAVTASCIPRDMRRGDSPADLVRKTPRYRALCRDRQTGTAAIRQCQNRQLPGGSAHWRVPK